MPVVAERDLHFIHRAITLSEASRAQGFHPFAALVVDGAGNVLSEAMNASKQDRTAHAEMEALRLASSRWSPQELADATLYTSAEPCAMCAGAAYWAGVGRVVYALSEASLLGLTGNDPENPTLALPCREVFARGQRVIEVLGPLCEAEAAAAHAGFWRPETSV